MTTISDASPGAAHELEAPLLAVLLHLERWPYDAVTGAQLTTDLKTLLREFRRLFLSDAADFDATEFHCAGNLALRSCIDRAWVMVDLPYSASSQQAAKSGPPTDHGTLPDGTSPDGILPDGTVLRLTSAGRQRALPLHRRLMARGFDELLVRATESIAYEAFCRTSLGLAVGQFSPVDSVQLALLLSCVHGGLVKGRGGSRSSRILDLGCGSGGITSWLAEATDAIAYGVDVAAGPLDAGRRQFAHRAPGRWQLHPADITALSLPPGSFDVLVAIDVVAFLDTPREVLAGWLELLEPGGRLVVLASEQGPSAAACRPGFLPDSPTSRFKATWVDLSPMELGIYRRQLRSLDAQRFAFEQEGNLPLHGLLSRETRRSAQWAEEDRSRRWLTVLRPV